MTTLDSIHEYVQKLPDSLQQEVLDFVKFLLFKHEQELAPEQEEIEWSNFSFALAMQDMTDEDDPTYTVDDLKEDFS